MVKRPDCEEAVVHGQLGQLKTSLLSEIWFAARKTHHKLTKRHGKSNAKPVFLDRRYVVLQNTTCNWGRLNACRARSWTTTARPNDFRDVSNCWRGFQTTAVFAVCGSLMRKYLLWPALSTHKMIEFIRQQLGRRTSTWRVSCENASTSAKAWWCRSVSRAWARRG